MRKYENFEDDNKNKRSNERRNMEKVQPVKGNGVNGDSFLDTQRPGENQGHTAGGIGKKFLDQIKGSKEDL